MAFAMHWHRRTRQHAQQEAAAEQALLHLQTACAHSAAPGGRADDLVRDITEVLTTMCARLYGGQGAAKNRAARAVAVATGAEA